MATTSALCGFVGSALVSGLVLWRRKALRRLVVVVNESALKTTLAGLERGGLHNLCVVMDFDRTITTYYGPGRNGKGKSCHGILEAIRSPATRAKADALNQKYYPIETSAKLSMEEKLPWMEEWYGKINALLLEDGLRKEDVEASVARSGVLLRPGVSEIIDFCAVHKVPLLIFSAGIGDVLQEVLLQRYGLLPPEVAIVSNWMEFGADGALVGWSSPVLHMFNKNEGRLLGDPDFAHFLERRNVVLCGDSLGDAAMVDGGLKPHEHVLKFGLLNDDLQALLPQYEALYDVVLLDDAPLYAAVAVLQRIAAAAAAGGGDVEGSSGGGTGGGAAPTAAAAGSRGRAGSTVAATTAEWIAHVAFKHVQVHAGPTPPLVRQRSTSVVRVPQFE